jgi:hypothetical protein
MEKIGHRAVIIADSIYFNMEGEVTYEYEECGCVFVQLTGMMEPILFAATEVRILE